MGWDGIERTVVSLPIVGSSSRLFVCLCVCLCVRVCAYVSAPVMDLISTQVPENEKPDAMGRTGDDAPIDGFSRTCSDPTSSSNHKQYEIMKYYEDRMTYIAKKEEEGGT